jgi:hypothetical protein
MAGDALTTRPARDGTVPGAAARLLMRLAWPATARLEAACFGDAPPRQPPLFVVGLPRAGTTLILQTLCHCLEVSYIPELARYAPFAPAFAAWAAHRARPRYRSGFTSHYGGSPGLASPGEATTWNLWFDKDRFYDDASQLPEAARRAIVGMVGRVERIGGGPFVNKNLRNNSRIRALARLLPNAHFLIVVRDPLAVAKSLLVGRAERAGGLSAWFSIKPRDYESFRAAPPGEQVARQVAGLLRDLAADAAGVGGQRFAAVAYEDFCARPARFLDDLAAAFGAGGAAFRRVADPPPSHAAGGARPLPFDAAAIGDVEGALREVGAAELAAGLPATWLAR